MLAGMKQEGSYILQRLIDHGYEAYFVGGYVRDFMLNRTIKDIDIATSAMPSKVIELFSYTIPTGLKHGTVTVIINNCAFEVTTFRREMKYEDFRRPEQVDFIDNLQEDLQRRDFTMNAMAMDLAGNLIDPFEGMMDLGRGLLRCVGDAFERFNEDGLRMMRCIRFAAEYELQIETSTWQALLAQRIALRHIAMERIRMELDRIIEGNAPDRGIALLAESQISNYFKVDIGFSFDLVQNSMQSKNVISKLNDGHLRWVLIFIMTRTSSLKARAILRKLKCSGNKIQSVCNILSFHEWFIQTDQSEQDWKLGVIHFNQKTLEAWREIAVIVKMVNANLHWMELSNETVNSIEKYGLLWIQGMPVKHVNELQISGHDLLQLRETPGPWMSEILHQLLIETALERVQNQMDELFEFAKKAVRELESK